MMLRKTLTILSIIGLLLSVGLWGVILLGVITTFQWNRYIGEDFLALWGSSTSIRVGYADVVHAIPDESAEMTSSTLYGAKWLGFVYREYTQRSGASIHSRFYHVQCHVILAILLSTCLPAWLVRASWRRRRRRKRKKLGLCQKCGYNLKGLTELRCPECGEAFEKTCSVRF